MMLRPDLALVLAPNASPMTGHGTNTYLLGQETLAVIDPGPDDPDHLAALLAAIDGRKVTHLLVTHSHLDHAPLARPLQTITGAPIFAFGDSDAGKSAIMQQLAAAGVAGGGEGIDRDFSPDMHVQDGQDIGGDWGQVTALHTPGHIGNHLCFVWGDAVFTGDHVMGWASSLVSPPDGDLTDFMASCKRLQRVPAQVYFPGHGAPITDPAARLTWLIDHRTNREAQILAALSDVPLPIAEITRKIYTDVPKGLLAAAERNVFAHLVDLYTRRQVTATPLLSTTATFALIPQKTPSP